MHGCTLHVLYFLVLVLKQMIHNTCIMCVNNTVNPSTREGSNLFSRVQFIVRLDWFFLSHILLPIIITNYSFSLLSLQRWVDMAIMSLTLSSMCSCTWLQSSPPLPPPPPRLRACCYSSTQLSVLNTLTHIHSSGVIACLRANRSLSLSL